MFVKLLHDYLVIIILGGVAEDKGAEHMVSLGYHGVHKGIDLDFPGILVKLRCYSKTFKSMLPLGPFSWSTEVKVTWRVELRHCRLPEVQNETRRDERKARNFWHLVIIGHVRAMADYCSALFRPAARTVNSRCIADPHLSSMVPRTMTPPTIIFSTVLTCHICFVI